MNLDHTKYVIVTPVRDEEAYLRYTIESMIQQTLRPTEWVIVNDGSTDNTGNIIDDYASEYEWIRPIHRNNRGFRKAGGGVVEAFKEGYRHLRSSDWQFVVKLDGDLSFAPDYFERCFEKFKQNSELGIGGGTIFNLVNAQKVLEKCPAFHVRGATKIYRRACWEAIGGIWSVPGWDTVDEVKASMLGWTTLTFDDLPLTHYRVTGSAEGRLSGFVKDGRADYICGYHPLFMLAKCVRRVFLKPYVVGAVALSYGFISGYMKRIPRVDEPATIAYLRQQQLGRLFGGKTIWR